MMVIGLAKEDQQVSIKDLVDASKNMSLIQVDFQLPKVQSELTLSAKEFLIAQGMNRAFDGNLADFDGMDQTVAADILFQDFFQSVKPIIILPIILMGVGVLFIANLFLVVMISALSMLFKFNQSNFPSYKNLIKLFMLASTIPAILNVFLGFLGLSAFTSLSYNFITPVIAFLMYRASRTKELIELENL
mgnify:CR=1 FL=1